MYINLQLPSFRGCPLLPWGISVVLPTSFNICRYKCFKFLTDLLDSLYSFECRVLQWTFQYPNDLRLTVQCMDLYRQGTGGTNLQNVPKMFVAIKAWDFFTTRKIRTLNGAQTVMDFTVHVCVADFMQLHRVPKQLKNLLFFKPCYLLSHVNFIIHMHVTNLQV